MQITKQCRTCEFNDSGTCRGHGNTYRYGEIIADDSIGCDSWGENQKHFTEITTKAPWYIREPYADYKIYYPRFLELVEADGKGQAIEVNIFDAIRKIYSLSLVDLAVILDVSFGVMYKARSVGVPNKRLHKFSQTLCIPASFFQMFTTHNFEELKMCKNEFEKLEDVDYILQKAPEWKEKMTVEVANYLHCPIHIAREISRVDKLIWKKEYTDALNGGEKALIDFVSKTGKKSKQSLLSLDYKLDIGCHPNISMTLRKD
ncbi:MAG: hypothetical protein EOM59_06235 [Clostridia bacterium]|nr:hypothetical protein [Clostridia bacterium]